MLAERQLQLGQSAILDSVAGTPSIRKAWLDMCVTYGASWRIIECVCSDYAVHKDRLAAHQHDIPGGRELDWSDLERVKDYYVPWKEEHLVLDMIYPYARNLKLATRYAA